MSKEAPERIWVDPTATGTICTTFQQGDIEYVRADKVAEAKAEVWKEALKICNTKDGADEITLAIQRRFNKAARGAKDAVVHQNKKSG